MITPRPYKTSIQPRTFGFSRHLSVGDFYDVWQTIAAQEQYPGISPVEVRLVLKQEIIRDFANFIGYGEIPASRSQRVMEDSSLTFSSPDQRLVGKIKRNDFDYEKKDIRMRVPLLEILGGLVGAAYIVASQPTQSIGVAGILSILDASRRFYNLGQNVLQIGVGTPYDPEYASIAHEARKKQPDHRPLRPVLVDTNDLSGMVDKLIDSARESNVEPSPGPLYDEKEMERFHEFVEHIKKIRI